MEGAIAARLLSLIERPDESVPQATILPVGLAERGQRRAPCPPLKPCRKTNRAGQAASVR